jgi:hypothetical protein
MSFPLRIFCSLLLATSTALHATTASSVPVPVGEAEWAALKARDESATLGELQAGEERPSILVPLMVVGFLSIVLWSVTGDDKREVVDFDTLDTDGEE